MVGCSDFIALIIILLLYGCNRKESIDVKYIESNIWNLDLTGIDKSHLSMLEDSVYRSKLAHIPIFFKQGYLYQECMDGAIDSCVFKTDTLLITSSYEKSGYGSMHHRVLDTVFMGKIIKSTPDSLHILRIKDNIFSFYLGNTSKNKTLKFYNDLLLTKTKTSFKRISLSTGLCYGTCPNQAFDLDSLGIIHYYGGKYASKKGYYVGKLNNVILDSIKHILSAALISRAAFNFYSKSADEPGTDIKIVMMNDDTIKISGSIHGFHLRLSQIYFMLDNSYRTGAVTREPFYEFLADKYIKRQD